MAVTSAARRRILFVDDEPQILASLRMVMRRENARWDMVFIEDAEAALAACDSAPFDLIVSDMRMPVMDGARLLSIVQERWPATVRFILSGHAELETVLRALPSMHQFLSKPVSPAVLRATIERGLTLANGCEDPAVREAIARIDRLPTPPALYRALTDLANDPHGTLGGAVSLVETDPALAAKLLQLASSAAFGTGRAVTSMETAVRYVGLEVVRMLALTTSVFAPSGPSLALDIAAMRETALATALLARDLCDAGTDEDRAAGDLVFSAALLREVGKLVLALGFPRDYAKVSLEVDHAAVGGHLLNIWGLPPELAHAVATHRAPTSRAAAMVHFAGSIVDGAVPDAAILGAAGIDTDTYAVWNGLSEAFRAET